MLFSIHGDLPSEAFFTGLDMLANFLNIEAEGDDIIGHLGMN